MKDQVQSEQVKLPSSAMIHAGGGDESRDTYTAKSQSASCGVTESMKELVPAVKSDGLRACDVSIPIALVEVSGGFNSANAAVSTTIAVSS